MQLESPLATPQPNLWQDDGINRASCQTFLEKAFFERVMRQQFSQKCYIFATWWGGLDKNETAQAGENWANNRFRFRRFLIRRSQVRILLGVPENQNRRMVVFILCITPQDLNLRKSSSNRRKKADGSTPVCVSKFCQVAQQSCWACQKIKTAVW